jgi:uncharacterized protein (UPF0335 family)
MSEAGHNGQLQSIVERIENLDGEIKDLRDDQKEVYSEAKSNGYDVKVLRKVVALRKQDPAVRAEQQAVMETYLHALGMLADA